MEIEIKQAYFLDVVFIDNEQNCGNNSDRFTFKLKSGNGGQPIEVNGKEVDEVCFDVIGNIELSELLKAMTAISAITRWDTNP